MRTGLQTRLRRLEQRRNPHDGLTNVDRAHMLAWEARVAEKYRGGPPPTDEQRALLARPRFWERLQAAWGRPGFARLCIQAMEEERRRNPFRSRANP